MIKLDLLTLNSNSSCGKVQSGGGNGGARGEILKAGSFRYDRTQADLSLACPSARTFHLNI